MIVEKMLFCISVPGGEIECIDVGVLRDYLFKNNINFNNVDSVPSWGCLNQDWVEFTCKGNTSWEWVEPIISEDKNVQKQFWEWFNLKLVKGQLIMICFYKNGDIHDPHI